jgi:L,D-transpeptidase catalytic domain
MARAITKKRFERRIDPVRLKGLLQNVNILGLFIVIAMSASHRSFAADHGSGAPAWLSAHIGEGEGQIVQPVLERARALYLQKISEGLVKNPCYFAMDATRPNGRRRFYIICESEQSFRVISAGHGAGRNLEGTADFANARQCAKNFGNAMDSDLTAGGAYATRETKTSFKGYYRVSATQNAVFARAFVQFDGEGETANARQREIGGHAAVTVKGICLRKDPSSPYANQDGHVPFGKLVDYAGGRSNGCTSWSPSDARQIIAMVTDNPTTLYIYPDAADIRAVARAVAGGRSLSRAGLYWNAFCLKEIRAPKFWPRETLEPVLVQYKKDHPAPPPRPTPICKEQ